MATPRATGQVIPDFSIATLKGDLWHSRAPLDCAYRLLVLYRGMWCPHCKAQLTELETLCESCVAAGVQPIAASADTSDRTNATRLELGLEKVELGYEMPIETARDLGVFISFGINNREMPLFCEPASFLISSKNRIQAAWVASNALARAHAGSSELRRIHKGAPPGRAPRGSA